MKTASGSQITSKNVTPVPPKKNVNDLRQNPGYSNVDIFTYNEMKLATKFFRPDYILGEGGFGVVYKGVIDENVRPGYKTTFVAIKELNRGGYQGDREWLVFFISSFLFFIFYFFCFVVIIVLLLYLVIRNQTSLFAWNFHIKNELNCCFSALLLLLFFSKKKKENYIIVLFCRQKSTI